MFIPFGLGAYDNNYFNLPAIELENWFAQEAPEEPQKGARLIPTPGMVPFATGFSGAASGVFQADRVAGGDIIVCTDSTVYKVNSSGVVSSLGSVQTGGLAAQFAVSQTPDLVLNKGGKVYTVTASALTDFTASLPLTNPIIGVAEVAQRHLYAEQNSGRFWYSDVANATTVQANSFYTAEQDPDEILGLYINGEEIWVFGTKTTELWVSTGDSTNPFAYRGVTLTKGLLGSRAVAVSDSALHFVGHDRMIYRMAGYRADRVSTHAIEEVLQSETNMDGLELTSYAQTGHSFLKVHVPSYGDLFLDAATGMWHRRRCLTTTKSNFGYPVEAFNKQLFLGDAGGVTKLYEASVTTFTDDGDNVRRLAMSYIPINDGRFRVTRATIDCQAGVGLDGNGQGSDPLVMFSVARDGRKFGKEITRSVGRVGEYGYRPTFGPLGVMKGPQVAVRLAVSDPVGLSVVGSHINLVRP